MQHKENRIIKERSCKMENERKKRQEEADTLNVIKTLHNLPLVFISVLFCYTFIHCPVIYDST